MRYLFSLVLLVLLAACNALAPTAPAPRATNPAPVPTSTAQPPATTPFETPLARPSANVPGTVPSASAAPFAAALRPEDQGELATVLSPTIYRMDLYLDPALTQLTGQEVVTYTNREQGPLGEI